MKPDGGALPDDGHRLFRGCFLGWLGILLIVTPIFILDIVMWTRCAFFGTEVG